MPVTCVIVGWKEFLCPWNVTAENLKKMPMQCKYDAMVIELETLGCISVFFITSALISLIKLCSFSAALSV